MEQNETPSPIEGLTPQQEEAALLLAQATLDHTAIAAKVGAARNTIWRWRKAEAFAARVREYAAEIREEIKGFGISIRENRIAALQDRWERMSRVIRERAEDLDMQTVPGGASGLLVRDVKIVGSGSNSERIDLYAVDTALLKEMRETERQAAQENGQWDESRTDEMMPGAEIHVRPMTGGSFRKPKPTNEPPDAG